MKTFKDFLNEGVKIQYIDPEEDWELAAQAEKIFSMSGIRPSRDKDISLVAIDDQNDDKVLGGVASSWTRDNDYGNSTHTYSFDVAVDPQARNASLVGPKLIDDAIKNYKSQSHDYENSCMKLQVVNPKLAEYLKRKYQWDDESNVGTYTYLTKY